MCFPFQFLRITGRSIACVTENSEIMDTLGIHRARKDDRLSVFDLFDATGIVEDLKDVEQNILHNGKRIQRTSKLKRNMTTGWTWNRDATYRIESDREKEAFTDLTTLRAFAKDEILLFLK
jgi:hypothetical protein